MSFTPMSFTPWTDGNCYTIDQRSSDGRSEDVSVVDADEARIFEMNITEAMRRVAHLLEVETEKRGRIQMGIKKPVLLSPELEECREVVSNALEGIPSPTPTPTERNARLVKALGNAVKSLQWTLSVMPDIPLGSEFRETLADARALVSAEKGQS